MKKNEAEELAEWLNNFGGMHVRTGRDRRMLATAQKLFKQPRPTPPQPRSRKPNDGEDDEPWAVYFWIQAPMGAWITTFYLADIPKWELQAAFDRLLECTRRSLTGRCVIAASKVPWEEERRIYDPPLGRIE